MTRLDSVQDGCWVNLTYPSEDELNTVAVTLGVEPSFLRAALDEEETSRIDTEDGQTLIIIDVPAVEKDDAVVYSTLPLGIIVTDKHIITVCLKETSILKDFQDGLVRFAETQKRTSFILYMLLQVAKRFLQYLKEIDKIYNYMERQLYKSQRNKELIQLLDLEKSLVYFNTSLKANEVTLEKILRGRIITLYEEDHDLLEEVKRDYLDAFKAAMDTDDKTVRDARLLPIRNELEEKYAEQWGAATIEELMYKMQKFVVRRWLLDEGKRVDGRGINEIRPLAAEVGLLPRVHGSGMFTRGQTQVLTAVTLSGLRDAQIMDDISLEPTKRYMHHYNFPPYSVGEARAPRSPGRREIGHGALAERALLPVLPSVEEFPYAIRGVSEVLSSNGSTSQASICGSTLALMDAGVPIKKPVAGISCGLITEGDRWMTMLDIQGVEDFHGDMDFKVGGTRDGITAIQMDMKVDGLTYEIIEEAFEKCRKARLYILDEIMAPGIAEPRAELSKYAPKMLSMKIDVDKIRDVIGKGGKVIQEICANCNAKIDIEEDGSVFISAIDIADAERAMHTIKTIVEDPEIGAIYKGKVTRLMTFGAFVEIAPGKEGLVHISKLDTKRVEKVEDVVAVGDELLVKVTEIDQQGRINLSRKDALADLAAKQK